MPKRYICWVLCVEKMSLQWTVDAECGIDAEAMGQRPSFALAMGLQNRARLERDSRQFKRTRACINQVMQLAYEQREHALFYAQSRFPGVILDGVHLPSTQTLRKLGYYWVPCLESEAALQDQSYMIQKYGPNWVAAMRTHVADYDFVKELLENASTSNSQMLLQFAAAVYTVAERDRCGAESPVSR